MAVPSINPEHIRWPHPWALIADEEEALSFGRWINPEVASTVLGELHREICGSHPLHGVECVPLAYDSHVSKDFIFATDHPEMPIVMMHFTWAVESDHLHPSVTSFKSVKQFLRSPQCRERTSFVRNLLSKLTRFCNWEPLH